MNKWIYFTIGWLGLAIAMNHALEWYSGEPASAFIWAWSIMAPAMLGFIMIARGTVASRSASKQRA